MLKMLPLLLLMLTVLVPARPQAPTAGFDEAAEQELIRLVNQERAKAGLPALVTDDRLTRAARQHTLLMAQRSQLSHQFPGEAAPAQRLAATGIRFNREGENVALDSGTPADVHLGLMQSPPHRANIMSPEYNAVGVGAVRAGGVVYVTEDFAHRLQEYTPQQAEDAAAGAFARMRQRARAPHCARIDLPKLRDLACAMAQKRQLNTRAGLELPGVRYVVAYTETEPQRLPASAARLAPDRALQKFAVGACYATSNKYPSGTWWVLMVFY